MFCIPPDAAPLAGVAATFLRSYLAPLVFCPHATERNTLSLILQAGVGISLLGLQEISRVPDC